MNETPKAQANDGIVEMIASLQYAQANLNSEESEYITRNQILLDRLYRKSWIIGNSIDLYAKDMTRSGVSIEGEIDPDDITKINRELSRRGVWNHLADGIRWGRLYGGAIAYIDIIGQSPETELDFKTVTLSQFAGIKVFDRWRITPDIHSFKFIKSGQNAGLPSFYQVNQSQGMESALIIHHSRIIRFSGVKLPFTEAQREDYWGASIVERIMKAVDNFSNSMEAAGSLVQKSFLRTVKVDGLREIIASGGKAQDNIYKWFSMVKILQGIEGLTLLDKTDDFQTNNHTFSGLTDILTQFKQDVAGATGIPIVKLFGQSPAGLNSTGESDVRNYYDSIFTEQEETLREGLTAVFQCAYRSLFGKPPPEDFDFSFNSLWQMSDKEKAEIGKTVTETIVRAHQEGLVDTPTAMRELKQASKVSGLFTNITDESIKEAAISPAPDMDGNDNEDLKSTNEKVSNAS